MRIRELAAEVAGACAHQGRLAYDLTQPDGQPRRALDTSLALQRFGSRAHVAFQSGLATTVEWYRAHSASAFSA